MQDYNIERNRTASEKERDQAERYKREIQTLKESLNQEREKLEKEKESTLNQARQEARKILTEARREADEVFEKLKDLEKAQNKMLQEHELMQMKQNLRQKMDGLESSLVESVLPRKGYAKPPKNIKSGDTVQILNLNQKGTVLDTPDKDGNVQVQAGIMKIKVHITQLRLVDEQKQVVESYHGARTTGVKSGNIKPELDIRGYNIEEALVTMTEEATVTYWDR